VWGAAGWGLAATLPTWGYGYGYTYENPYYTYAAPVVETQPAYDYSQPIVINTYNTPTADASATAEPAQPAPTAEETAGYQFFDQARTAFTKGDYKSALKLDEQAIQQIPSDPILHEFGALCLFALGEYDRAAGVLNALLAVAPGMDWTTMSGMYSDVDAYTKQLRALESFCKQNPQDAAAQFVLAYHYLVTGQNDPAIKLLQRVTAAQPKDLVAKRLLDALSPPETATASTPAPAAAPDAQAAAAPTTDLVGNWRAERDGDVFELTIDEQGQFTWKATPKGKTTITLSGNVLASADTLVLESQDQGSMVGNVSAGGPDKFQFVSTGGPPNDQGLAFERVKT